jgi:Kef-type K+ transport system membrane component KefB
VRGGDDVTAWCLLALVVGLVQAAPGSALLVTALTLAFIGVMFGAVRPLLRGWCVHPGIASRRAASSL